MIRVVYNGRIYINRAHFCEALIIENGRVAAIGSSREMRETAPAGAEHIDAAGALVLPAFNDSHIHLMWMGRRAGCIEGAGADSIAEVIRRGRAYIARYNPPPGTYVQGDGVNPDFFTAGEKRDLCREDVDAISTDHPVILSRHCGHTIYCNSLALRLAGFGDSAPDFENGVIEKDENGRPTGVVRESANALIRKPMPALSRNDMKDHLTRAMRMAHARGVTACGSYDADGPDFENIVAVYRDIYEEAQKAGVPALRVTMQCGISAREDILDEYLKMRKDFTTEYTEEEAPPSLRVPPCPSVVNYSCHPIWGSFLKMGPIKLFGDGTLGTHTAWMRRPYRDKPETRGVPVLDDQTITHLVQKASAGGMQVLVHSIGDAGIDSVLSAFETVTAPGNNPLRHGIIHCQITAADLLERMSENKILALVQPVFLAEDRHILERRVGQELAATSYAWGSMRRLGIPVSYSTDAPVSGIDPLQCISWAVLRRDSDNPDSTVFNPGERVDVYSAVDAYTAGSAFSAFDEKERGRIAPGYLADLVFLDRDIFTIPPEDIGKTRVVRTICAGETVWEG